MSGILTTLRELVSRGLWVAVAGGGVLGGLQLLAVLAADSAPQQGALAASAAASAVLPYCVARAFDEITRPTTTVR